MADTWLLEGIRERLSVQGGVTVAKSQTHALYTIEVFADEIGTEITGGSCQATVRHVTSLRPSGGEEDHLDFSTAIPTLTGEIPPPQGLVPVSLVVCLTHVAEAHSLSSSSDPVAAREREGATLSLHL